MFGFIPRIQKVVARFCLSNSNGSESPGAEIEDQTRHMGDLAENKPALLCGSPTSTQELIEKPPGSGEVGVGCSSRKFLPKLIKIQTRYRNSIWLRVEGANATLWLYRRGSLPLGSLGDTDTDELSGTM